MKWLWRSPIKDVCNDDDFFTDSHHLESCIKMTLKNVKKKYFESKTLKLVPWVKRS